MAAGRIGISEEALGRMAAYPWPGNVRELRNAVHRAAVLSFGPAIRLADLPREVRDCSGQDSSAEDAELMPDTVPGSESDELTRASDRDGWNLDAQIERHLVRVLTAADGNKTRAAELLGIPRTSLYHKLRKYGLEDA